MSDYKARLNNLIEKLDGLSPEDRVNLSSLVEETTARHEKLAANREETRARTAQMEVVVKSISASKTTV